MNKGFQIFVAISLIFSSIACDTYNENDHSIPIPETFEGKVIDENSKGLIGVRVEVLIRSNQHGVGPDGVPKDRLKRRITSESDANGRYFFDFRSESKKIAADFPSFTAVIDRSFAIKVKGFEYVFVKFDGNTTFMVRQSELLPEGKKP